MVNCSVSVSPGQWSIAFTCVTEWWSMSSLQHPMHHGKKWGPLQSQSFSKVNTLSLHLSKTCRCLLGCNWLHFCVVPDILMSSSGSCWTESDARKHQKVVYLYCTFLISCFPPIHANTFCLSGDRLSQCLLKHLSISLFLLIPTTLVSVWSVNSSLLSLGIFLPPG